MVGTMTRFALMAAVALAASAAAGCDEDGSYSMSTAQAQTGGAAPQDEPTRGGDSGNDPEATKPQAANETTSRVPDTSSDSAETAQATFAAGCFWGVEAAFRQLDGVVSTTVGYTGGHVENPTYRQVCSHTTGHAEAVRVTYDPSEIKYEDLLKVFWETHDPTQVNRQGPDVGDQYRSGIFYHNEAQRKAAEASKKALDDSGKLSKPVATEITEAPTFWKAEDYHQQYLEKRGMATCHPNLK